MRGREGKERKGNRKRKEKRKGKWEGVILGGNLNLEGSNANSG